MKKLLLIGGGGHCHSVIDSILMLNSYEKIGIIDDKDCSFLGISTIGTDYDVSRLFQEGWTDAFITVGSIGNTDLRHRLYHMIVDLGLAIPNIVDPTATIAKDVKIQQGTYVGKKAVINAGSKIGECAVINTGAIIEHDCMVGPFAHISPGATLCGQVHVGENAHVGAGAVVKQLVKIGDHSLIGAGSVVVKDIPKNIVVYGNPCRLVEQ